MNYKVTFNVVGRILLLNAGLMLIPLITGLIYGEFKQTLAFLMTIIISAVLGAVLLLVMKNSNQKIYAREGFFIVSLGWITLSLIGALPFFISREIPNYIDAVFETTSGFTTTGASILTDVETMSHCMLMWRSFTHWIGGMGILVMLTALFPYNSDRTIHILKAEVPGPQFGKLRPKLSDTAKILYIIYTALTIIEMIMLWIGGMPLFDSIIHTFGTAGTGGFGIRNLSITEYSAYSQWVIAVFMFLFGVNFNIYFFTIIGKFKEAIKSTELIVYSSITIISTLIVTFNILSISANFGEAIRLAFFQVTSISTTTGYLTADPNTWPELSRSILFILMFIGACAGSTAGGLKVSRIIILFNTVKKNIKRVFYPREITTVKFEGKAVDSTTVHGINSYFVLFVMLLASGFIILSIFNPDKGLEINLTATLSCLNNIGPYMGSSVPYDGYATFHWVSKITLIFAMLFGRLEIYPMMFMFIPKAWLNKNNI